MTADDYRPDDEDSWLRCRVLAFLSTAYFDDVVTRKPDLDAAVQLVVRSDGQVIGLLDASVDGSAATIETVAVHPDHRRRGVAGELLDRATERLRERGVTSVDAWTRDDIATLRWYAESGFSECDHYLHVYADEYAGDLDEPTIAAVRDATGLRVIRLFAHAALEREAELRARYRRVHVCRRMTLAI